MTLDNVQEIKSFLIDLCTKTELQAMAERLQAASLIKQGLAYREISNKTGLSTTTVTRIAHWIENGEQGYNMVLKRLNENNKTS